MADQVTVDELEDRLALFTRLRYQTMHRYFLSIGMFNGNPFMLFHIRRRPGITQKELARSMEISPASVAISVKRLETAGLILRQRDEQDGRVIHLFLTPAGEKMDAACATGRDFMIDSLYRGLTTEEVTAFSALLYKVTQNLQDAMNRLPLSDSGLTGYTAERTDENETME